MVRLRISSMNDFFSFCKKVLDANPGTAYRLSSKSGFDRGTVKRWYNRERNPKLESFINFLNTMGLEIVIHSQSEKVSEIEPKPKAIKMNKNQREPNSEEVFYYDKMKNNYSENLVNEISELSNKEKRALMRDLGLLIAYSNMNTTE